LADRVGAIARGTERLRDRHAALVERASIPRVTTILDHVADARLVRIEAGEKRRPRRAAAPGVVKLREAKAVLRESIEGRRPDLAAVAAEVGEAHVVREDDDDVGTLIGGRLRLGEQRNVGGEEEEGEKEEAREASSHVRSRS